MKIAVIILSCLCFCLLIVGSYLCLVIAGLQITNTDLNAQVIQLEKDVTLRDDIISDMEQMAYPKSFENQKMLEKWLKTTSDKSNDEYYSESAMKLIKEARADGYWMGLAPVNFVYDKDGYPDYIEYPVAANSMVICLTVVGGDTLYLVDPPNLSVMKITTMQADFDLNDLKFK